MIFEATNILAEDLNDFLGRRAGLNNAVKLEQVDENSPQGTAQVSITVINVEEDRNFFNHPETVSGSTFVPSRYNLYLLYTFKSQTSYAQAIKLLGFVAQYYHYKRNLTDQNMQITSAVLQGLTFDWEIIQHNIDLEESKNLWTNFGGKQFPFLLYKLQLVEMAPETLPLATGTPVASVNSSLSNL